MKSYRLHHPNALDFEALPPASKSQEALIQEKCKEIDANTDRVIELFLDEVTYLRRQGKGDGTVEMIEIAVKAMNAWPVFEKLLAGITANPDERKHIPALFQVLRPRIQERDVLVRQAAEKELQP